MQPVLQPVSDTRSADVEAGSKMPHQSAAKARNSRRFRCHICLALCACWAVIITISAMGLAQLQHVVGDVTQVSMRPESESVVISVGATVSRWPWFHAVRLDGARCTVVLPGEQESVVAELARPTGVSQHHKNVTASVTLSIVAVGPLRAALHEWLDAKLDAEAWLACSAHGWLTSGVLHVPFRLSHTFHMTLTPTQGKSLTWQLGVSGGGTARSHPGRLLGEMLGKRNEGATGQDGAEDAIAHPAIHITTHASHAFGDSVSKVSEWMEAFSHPHLHLDTAGWSGALESGGRVSVATGPRPLGQEVPIGRLAATSDLLTDVSLSVELLLRPWAKELKLALRRAMPSLRSFVVDPHALRLQITLAAALELLGRPLAQSEDPRPPPRTETAGGEQPAGGARSTKTGVVALVSRLKVVLEPSDLRTDIDLVALPPSLSAVLTLRGADANTNADADANTDADADADAHRFATDSSASPLAPSLWPRYCSPPPRDLLWSSGNGRHNGDADGDGDGTGWVGGGFGIQSALRSRNFVSRLLDVVVRVPHHLRADARFRHSSGANFESRVGWAQGSTVQGAKAGWMHAKMSGLSASNLRLLRPALRLTPRVDLDEAEGGAADGMEEGGAADVGDGGWSEEARGEVDGTGGRRLTHDGLPPAPPPLPPSNSTSNSISDPASATTSSPSPAPMDFDISLGDILGIGTTIGVRFHMAVRHGAIAVRGALLLNSTGLEANATLLQGCLGNTDGPTTGSTGTGGDCFTPLEVQAIVTPTTEQPTWCGPAAAPAGARPELPSSLDVGRNRWHVLRASSLLCPSLLRSCALASAVACCPLLVL